MFHLPARLADRDEPVKTGVIGAGLFGSNLIGQLERTPGLEATIVADLAVEKAVDGLTAGGVSREAIEVTDSVAAMQSAISAGRRVATTDSEGLIDADIDVVVEATGSADVAARHAYSAIMAGTHVVMATVEADTVVGPILAQLADANDVTYSMAYGDQPALIVELLEWARVNGFDVIAAGKGNPYIPSFRYGTPEDIFERIGFGAEFVASHDLNPRMYNSFYDGTKVAVEMCAVANAVGFTPDVPGMHLPTAEIPDIPNVLRPEADGGILRQTGVVETISSLHADGTPVERDIGFGVFVVTTTPNQRVRGYLDQNSGTGLYCANDGAYHLFHRPYHLPGLETGVSVAKAALDNQPTGTPVAQHTEVVAAAKRDLEPGEEIDGGGGSTVYGRLEARDRVETEGFVPFELLPGATITRPLARDDLVTEDDVELSEGSFLWTLRQLQDGTV